MVRNERREEMGRLMMYTHHGKKKTQGELCKVNGTLSLGYVENDKLVGFTTFEEMFQDACKRPIREFVV